MNRTARTGALSVSLLLLSLNRAWAQLPPPPGPASSPPPPPPPAASPAAGLNPDIEPEPAPAAVPDNPEPAAAAEAVPADKPAAAPAAAGEGITEEEFQALEAKRIERTERLKVTSALNGSTGLMRTHYAASGPVGSFRFGLLGSYMSTSGFLCPQCEPLDGGDPSRQDSVSRVGANIQIGATLWDFLEAYMGIHSTATSNSLEDPELLQVLGDSTWGLKGFMPAEPDQLFTAGGALELGILNGTGGIGIDQSNFVLRGLTTFDLSNYKEPADRLPLRFNFNLSYVFDNSGALVRDTELERHRRIRRSERYGLNINRVDRLVPAFAVEGTFEAIRPYLEWSIDVPSNRQDYRCIEPDLQAGDTCLQNQGDFYSVPSRLTLGVRGFAFLDGLSFHAALDLATGGNAPAFWEEVQPETPWNLHFGVAYAADTEPRVERVLVKAPPVEAPAEPAPPPVRYVVSGVVVQEGTENVTVANALIRYQGRNLTGMISSDAGAFQTVNLEPGTYTFDVSAPDYQDGTCQAVIVADAPAGTEGAASAEGAAGTEGLAGGVGTGQPSPPANPADPASADASLPAAEQAPAEQVRVTSVRCPLKAKPKLGTVVFVVTDGTTQTPIAGATVTPTTEDGRSLSLDSDESGATRFSNVPVGSLRVTIQAPGYLKTLRVVKVQPSQEVITAIEVFKATKGGITLGKGALTLKKPLQFKPGTAELLPAARGVVDELVAFLAENGKVSVELQAHTDDSLPFQSALALTTDRANAIRTLLLAGGVQASRVTALGMGGDKPLAPNSNDKNKEKNNRVEVIVKAGP